MTRRQLFLSCIPALLLVAGIVVMRSRPAASIDPASFDAIHDSMTLDDLRAMLGEPRGMVKNERGEWESAVLGKDWRWIIERHVLAEGAGNFAWEDRWEWVGECWGISVAFDDRGRIGSRTLWRFESQ